METAASLIAQAGQDSKGPNFQLQGLLKLRLILDEICTKHNFSSARGDYDFPLNPTLITTVNGITNFGGPYPLPLDYLRTSESSGTEGVQYSFFYVYNGVPYPLIPFDLGKGDMMVQQPGLQNLPYAYWTDMAPGSSASDRIIGMTTAEVIAGSNVITCNSVANMLVGQAVAGDGISPGSIINLIDAVHNNVTLSLPSIRAFAAITGPNAASITFGSPASLYVYPGPSGAFPARLRFQRLMPPIQDVARIPWFQDQAWILERLTAELMATTDDTRRDRMLANAERMLGKYEIFEGDKTNRAQNVILDRNRFGPSWDRLRNTKTIGW